MNFDLWARKIYGGYGEVFAGSSCLVNAGRRNKSKAHLVHLDDPVIESSGRRCARTATATKNNLIG